MLLAFNLPVEIPEYMAIIGCFVAIVIVKMLFGGIGQNFANPAITARIVLMVSFPAAMTNWVLPFEWKNSADAVTGATPLVLQGMSADELAEINQKIPSYLDLFLGNVGGCLGETSALALLMGGLCANN
jgi:electron transport complex protein RnfD